MKQKGVYGLAGHHDEKINTPNEVEHFLKGFKENDQLKSLLSTMYQQIQTLTQTLNSKASIQQLQNLTDVVNTKADKSQVEYDNVYIGVASDSATVINEAYHHDTINRGRQIAFSEADGYLFVVLPEQYTPAVLMSGTEVPMSLDNTVTIEEETFNVWKSNSEFTGSFNIYLF